ncbi:unnamed protein product [Allacma fusca]|uniref:NB-ARC domain-containing protein n=1 Tax=Allacma fusca TaxID=39272 RepID=A0A8J2K8T4_9HEXA|nr:unnamed protein product [Allacma fusca]
MDNNLGNSGRSAEIAQEQSDSTRESVPDPEDTKSPSETTNKITGVVITGSYHGDMKVSVTVKSPNSAERPKRLEFNVDGCVPTFTGRKDFIKDLHEDIVNNQKNKPPSARFQTVVIAGMAGVGKTQLVRKYIELYKSSYDHVLWINADSYSLAMSCFLRIAPKISIDLNYDGRRKLDEDILDEIWDFFCQKYTLIVYDNVEFFKAEDGKNGLHLLLPRINSEWRVPAIIVTTRNPNWENFTFRDLKGFDMNESWELLSKQDFNDTEDNRCLVEELQSLCNGLPVGVQQAVSLFRHKRKTSVGTSKGSYTSEDFLNEVSVSKKKFLSTEPPEFVSKNLYVLIEMILEQINSMEYGDLALRCLGLMAILNADNIPTVIINEFFKNEGDNLAEALVFLHDRNLVTSSEDCYQMPQMIQAVLLDSNKIESNFVQKKEHFMPAIINFFSQFLEGMDISSRQAHEIINIAAILEQQIPSDNDSEEFLKFRNVLSDKLEEFGSYNIAPSISEEELGANDVFSEEGDSEAIENKEGLCSKKVNPGRDQQSLTPSNDAFEIPDKIPGPEDPPTLNIENKIACVLESQEDPNENKVLGPEHPNTLTTKGSIADVLKSQEKYGKAYRIYNEVLEVRNRILGPENPKTLATKYNIAGVLDFQEKYEAAYRIYNEVLEAENKMLGPQHPDTLTTKQSIGIKKSLLTKIKIAGVLTSLEKYDEAYQLYNELLETGNKLLVPEHPKLLFTKSKMAGILEKQGKYEEAYQAYDEVLKVRNRILGPKHPKSVTTKTKMADILKRLEKHKEMCQIYNNVPETENKILGPDHPDTLVTKHDTELCSEDQRITEQEVDFVTERRCCKFL